MPINVRSDSDYGLHTAVFTHGHIDHCFGVERYEAEARTSSGLAPRVVAHEAVADRFDRYRATSGYNAIVGVDVVRYGYYNAKLQVEQMIERSGDGGGIVGMPLAQYISSQL